MSLQDDQRAIQQLGEDWALAMSGQDLDRLLSLMTDDIIFMPPHTPSIVGKKT